MKRSALKELIKRSMREVTPNTGAMTPEEEKMVADYEEEEANKHALDSERPMEEASSKSAEILNRPAGHMTFEQMGMIIMLADAVGENRGADEFLSKVSSKKEADRYIQSLIAKADGKEGVMNESMDLPDDIKWDVEEVLDYYDNYSADLIVHGYSPSTGKTYGGSVVGTEAGGGDWDFFEGDIEAIEEMPDDDDILAEAEKIVAAWAQKQTIKEEMIGGYIEVLGPDFENGVKMVEKAWNVWKAGPMTEPGMVDGAREDIMTHIGNALI